MRDENFRKSIELYLLEQELLIATLEQNIVNNEKMIELHTKSLKLNKETLIHEKMVLEQNKLR